MRSTVLPGEGESKGREVGSDDARQTESVSGGREG